VLIISYGNKKQSIVDIFKSELEWSEEEKE
jgi:hypothetical protein